MRALILILTAFVLAVTSLFIPVIMRAVGILIWLAAMIAGTIFAYTYAKMDQALMFSDSPRRFRQALEPRANEFAGISTLNLLCSLLPLSLSYGWYATAFVGVWIIWLVALYLILPRILRSMMRRYWRSQQKEQ